MRERSYSGRSFMMYYLYLQAGQKQHISTEDSTGIIAQLDHCSHGFRQTEVSRSTGGGGASAGELSVGWRGVVVLR